MLNQSYGYGSITDVPGIEVGHFTDTRRPTGCSVVICRNSATGSVSVRGASPGTRETNLLDPTSRVEQVHAVLLSGGSAWGLGAASGVMQWLDEQGIGMNVGMCRVPIVPAAVLFDLALGDSTIRPSAQDGYIASMNASTRNTEQGNVGAGAGATVGKLYGIHRAMKGGIGTASVTVGKITVGALVACNALGDVIDPNTGALIAGARYENSKQLCDARNSILLGSPPLPIISGTNTTIGVIATDAKLNKIQTHLLSQIGHDGLARSINPVHTLYDGDTLFALATGESTEPVDMTVLCVMAAEAVANATVQAVKLATSLQVGNLWLPGLGNLV